MATVRYLALLMAGLLVAAGCGGEVAPTTVAASPTPPATPTAVATAVPTATPTPTPTPSLSPTFAPGPVILPTVALPDATVTPDPLLRLSRKLDAVGFRTSSLRGLSALRPLDREIIDRDELSVRLREELEEERDEILKEQVLYRLLGVLAPEQDLYELLLTIYTDTVLGYFDPEEETLYVVSADDDLTPQDVLTFSHEYAHGLQQQHFDIHATGEMLEDDSDASLAFSALVEGDATILETLYMFQYFDEQEQLAAQEAGAGVSFDAFRSAPRLVQRTFTFPYIEGPRFVASLVRAANGWELVDQAFEDLPDSTEQVLHPEKYESGEAPIVVELPDIASALGPDWSELRRDTLGEFFLQAYLEAAFNVERAAEAASGWGGDSYALLSREDGRTLLVALIVWDTNSDAAEFFFGFTQFMQATADGVWEQVDGDGAAQLMSLPDKSVYVRIESDATLLIVGPERSVVETVAETVDDAS